MTDVLVNRDGTTENIDDDVVIITNELLQDADILKRFAQDLKRAGLVGEERAAKLIYLSVLSCLLPRPVPVKLEGVSSVGKSFIVEQCLKFFPNDAYYRITAMSEKVLIYGEEPLQHRCIVIAEAAGINGEFQEYLLRSLLSEGRLEYEFVQQTPGGPTPVRITREGPTGLLVTTTKLQLDPELETRMLSVPITDTAEQTKLVLVRLAEEDMPEVDFRPWRGLQRLIANGERSVALPFAKTLAELTPPVAVRLRRDFNAVLSLIRAHALLHQMNRDKDEKGRIIATPRDYEIVRELVADIVADGIGAAVPETIRQAVRAVSAAGENVTVACVAEALKLDKSSAHRRVQAARRRGYLQNQEERRGRPARLVLGDPLPADTSPLPTVTDLLEAMECKPNATAKCNP